MVILDQTSEEDPHKLRSKFIRKVDINFGIFKI
jgi:hypothetical protein